MALTPKRADWFAVQVLISLAVLGGSLAIFWKLGTAEKPASAVVDEPVPSVEIAPVRRHTSGIPIEVDGVVVPFREVALSAEVPGRVDFKAEDCRVGRTVQEGELLLRIDPRDYEFEILRLTKEVEQAEANRNELAADVASDKSLIMLAKEELSIRQRELQRYLDEEDPGVFSASEIDAARRNELTARNALQMLEDDLRRLEARQHRYQSVIELSQSQLEKARVDLTRTEIKAPLSGIVVSESVEQDAYVQRGSALVTIQDTSRYDVRASVNVRKGSWLWEAIQRRATEGPQTAFRLPSLPVEVVYSVGHDRHVWQGTLSRYDGAGIDQRTRMLPFRVHVEDPRAVSSRFEVGRSEGAPPTLMTGMFVKVRFVAQPDLKLLSLPEEAILPGSVVWTLTEQGTLRRNEVRVADAGGELTLVFEDPKSLTDGDRAVVSALVAPVDGQKVSVLKQP